MMGDRELTLLQRVLLNTDGTVTKVLEAYAGEPMRAVKLCHELEPLYVDSPGLQLGSHETVLRRSVLIRGRHSETNYLYGESLIVPDRLHPKVREGLFSTDLPIGLLLTQNRVETFREVLAVGEEPAGRCAEYFSLDEVSLMIFRTYRIISGGLPIMLITERFPSYAFAVQEDVDRIAVEEPVVALGAVVAEQAQAHVGD